MQQYHLLVTQSNFQDSKCFTSLLISKQVMEEKKN